MRAEQSVVFRFLRWLGNRLLEAPPWLQRVVPFARLLVASEPLAYARWVEEARLMDMIEKLGEREPSVSPLPLVSVVVVGGASVEVEAQAAARSLTHPSLEVHTCAQVIPSQIIRQCRGKFIAFLSSDALLEPGTIDAWVATADAGTNLVYSDWDHIDPDGTRHTPRFTPEYSPALLFWTLYFGDCFLVRAAALTDSDRVLSVHELACSVARKPGRVVRVPRVLWHASSQTLPDTSEAGDRRPKGTREAASIVICSRSPRLLRRCLTALKPTLGNGDEVIVVAHENGTDGPVSRAAMECGARAISYQGAFHFGFMNGEGARAATAPVIVFMNDDVFPAAPDWLDKMVAQAAQGDVGAVGALLLYPSGKIQHAGVVVGGHLGPTHIGRFLQESRLWPWLRMTREVTAVTGACLAIRRAVWDELGGFDPRFPVNYNDTDLCLRARKLGYRVVLEAGAVLTHEESQSRNPVVRPEEFALFTNLWSDVLEIADPYFHPALLLAEREIQLRSPLKPPAVTASPLFLDHTLRGTSFIAGAGFDLFARRGLVAAGFFGVRSGLFFGTLLGVFRRLRRQRENRQSGGQ